MAITVVQSKQTGSGSATTLGVENTTVGNRVIVFLSQTASVVAPTIKDSGTNGTTGWTVSSIKAEGAAKANSLWVAEKAIASLTGADSFSLITMTPGTGGIGQGLCAFELSGSSGVVDVSVKTDNPASAKTVTSPSVTTTEADDIVLGAVGAVNAALAATSWTGTGPMTRAGTESTRCLGGYYLPGATLSAATFTANWETSRQVGMLVIALKATPTASNLAMMV
jgi:hypothetical protein